MRRVSAACTSDSGRANHRQESGWAKLEECAGWRKTCFSVHFACFGYAAMQWLEWAGDCYWVGKRLGAVNFDGWCHWCGWLGVDVGMGTM